MKTKLSLCMLVLILCGIGISGCSKLPEGDKEVEQKLDGTWEAVYYDSEYEDGVELKIKVTETVTYEASSNKFEANLLAKLVEPLNINFFSVDVKGKWSADEKSLSQKYDTGAAKIEFHSGLIDASDRKELKKEFLSELDEKEVCEIREITDYSFTVFDGEDEIVYYRK